MDRWVRSEIRLFGLRGPAFQIFGYTGLGLAIILALTLTAQRGLSLWMETALIISAMATFLALAMVTKIILGRENLVYYHHELAVLMVSTVLLRFLDQPVLLYLDITLLGVGLFLAFGRVGCLMAGCCHGRPSRWGVCYREQEAAAGFTPYYTGIRLFPIQGIEALWVITIVLTGSRLVLIGQPAGTALVWYILAYSIGRFVFEFLRGDPARPYWLGLSEAQWFSLLLIYGVVFLEVAGFLPYHAWHSAAALGLFAVMAGIQWNRAKNGGRYALLQPRHVEEIAGVLNQVVLPDGQALPPVACTSLGIQISAGTDHGQAWIEHFTISSRLGSLTEDAARVICGLILLLQKRNSVEEHVFQGQPGIYHLLIQAPAQVLKPADPSGSRIDSTGRT